MQPGLPEQYDHPVFEEAVQTIIAKARARGVGAGVHFWENIESEIRWARAGANLMMHSGDITLFTQTLRADLRRFRQEFGDKSPEVGTSSQMV